MSILQGTGTRQATSIGANITRILGDCRFSWALVAFAILQESLGHLNADNSWLITVAERILAGNTPYVDFIETNPPASFLLYFPAVMLAQTAGLPIELVVSAFVFLVAGICIALAARVLLQAGLVGKNQGFLLNAAVFALVVLPGFSFAEREHVAAFGIVPLLAIYAVRSEGRRVPVAEAIAAGIAGGLVICIKPHFALAALVPLFYVLARRRSMLPVLGIENVAILVAVLAYVALVVERYPVFFDVLPSLLDAYVSMKSPIRELFLKPWFLLNIALFTGIAAFSGRRCLSPLIALPLSASLGFIGTFFLQGKGWVNHGLPGVSLALIAAAFLCMPGLRSLAQGMPDAPAWQSIRRFVLFGLVPSIFGAPILFGTVIQFMMWEEYSGLTAAVRRHAPEHPRLIAVSGELDVGHPLVRRLSGTWAGRPHSLWLMICSQALIDWNKGDAAFRARLTTYIERDARMFGEDMRNSHPDIVLVDDDVRTRKALLHPDVADAMANYRPVETVSGITLWVPRP